METDKNSTPNQEDLGMQEEVAVNSEVNVDVAAEKAPTPESTRKHHIDHGHRRYKMFSNHSSWNDMPHTNTSF